MTAQLSIFPETDMSVLVASPPQCDEHLLHRAGDVAELFGADLQIYCPVTRTVVPHSAVTPDISAASGESRGDRERARRTAGKVQHVLRESGIDGFVEAGLCVSLTDGILRETARLKPDLLILPFIRSDDILAAHDSIRYETVWSKLRIPVLIVNSENASGKNVAGYVAIDKLKNSDQNDSRISASAAWLASRLGAEAHLLCCLKPPAALAIAKEVIAPAAKGNAEVKDDAIADELLNLAGDHSIPNEHIHVHYRPAGSVLNELADSLNIGLLVADGRSRSLLDRLARRWPAAELLDHRCDVLILGEQGAGMDIA